MLLFASIVGYFIIKYCQGIIFTLTLISFLMVSMILLKFFPNHFPIVDQAHLPFLATFFFLFGYNIKKKYLLPKLLEKRMPLGFSSIIILLCGFLFWPSSMVSLNVVFCIPFCISAIAGTLLIYLLCASIKFTPPRTLQDYLLFLGNNTYSVLMMHILSFRLLSTILVYTLGLSHDMISEHPAIHFLSNEGYWILYLLFGINIPLLIQYLYNNTIKKWKK